VASSSRFEIHHPRRFTRAEAAAAAAFTLCTSGCASTGLEDGMDAIDRLIDFFEALDPQALNRIGEFYSADAWFKDPFNEVRGDGAVREIFARMFEQLDAPRFRVRERVFDGDQGFLVWDLEFRFRGSREPQTIHGVSHLRLDGDGRVRYHRDYWIPPKSCTRRSCCSG
jgi:ketosteroid isomerase-like protein